MSLDKDSSQEFAKEARRAQAADWVALQDAGLSAAQQDSFFEWLAADPKNSEVYTELTSVYRDLDIMVEWRPLHAIEPNPDLLASPRKPSQRQWWLASMGGMAAALILTFFVTRGDSVTPESQPTTAMLAAGSAARSYERHVLEDGSVVELNKGGQVSVRYEPGRRLLNLLAGEAHFTVATDPSRPFIVRAENMAVTAVGTEFNIAMQGDRLEVIVTEGRIRLDPALVAETEQPLEEVLAQPADHILDAGQGFEWSTAESPNPSVVSNYSGKVVAQKLAWKDELVDFSAASLGEVITEFNQRNSTQLVIGDAELADRQITGTLRLTNVEGFVELLSITQNVEAERHGRSKIVLRKRY